MKRVLVIKWLDAYGSDNEDGDHKLKEPLFNHLTESYGVIIDRDEYYIYLAHNKDGIKQVYDKIVAIPNTLVKEIIEIGVYNG